MKALLDEMIPPAVGVQLRQRGHDVIAVAERVDLRLLPDSDVFAFAQAEGRAIVTRDRADYILVEHEQRAAGRVHAGLVLISSRFAPGGVGALVKALDKFLVRDDPYPSFVHWL